MHSIAKSRECSRGYSILDQGPASFFCKGQNGNYLRCRGPYGLRQNFSAGAEWKQVWTTGVGVALFPKNCLQNRKCGEHIFLNAVPEVNEIQQDFFGLILLEVFL